MTATAWSVTLPLPLGPLDFGVPHGFVGAVPVGHRVVVPWQGELKIGVVVGEGHGASHRLRDAVTLLDALQDGPWLHPAFVSALLAESKLSRVPLGVLICELVCVGLDAKLAHRVRAVEGADLAVFGGDAPSEAWTDGLKMDAGLLDAIRAQGLLEEDVTPAPRTVSVIRALNAGREPLTPKQTVAWDWLRGRDSVATLSEWADLARVSASVVTGVLNRGWAERVDVPAPWPDLPPLGEAPRPTLDTLPEADVWRVHGGRASQRYRLLASRIARLLDIGRGVLVIAPDHMTLSRAWAHLSGLSSEERGRAVLFSGALSDQQRERTWDLVRSGAARLVIGTHAALCAPVADLALIVVDEEGSDAHKLRGGGSVFVPEVARRMAAGAECVLAWTGCVPSPEVLSVPGVVLPPPPARVHVVDFGAPPDAPELGPLSRADLRPGKQGYPLSHDLVKVLRQVAERGRQAVLLAPRRGYSALLRCPSCEHTPMCKHCDVPLRFHQETRQLTCHQCGYRERLHDRCEACGERMWQAKGPGTEWIASEVRKVLPDFPVLRFDKDRQDDLSRVDAGDSAVIVGTQALLTRPAPPDLALIGVTLADTWLNVSDFRASERYHRLLRQLLEWHPNRAPMLVVQTFQATHPALASVVAGHDAAHYPSLEQLTRQTLKYPPFARLAHIEVTARDQDRARGAAEAVAAALYGRGAQDGEVLGPAPSPIAKLRGAYPYHLLLRVRDEARLDTLLGALDARFSGRVRVDVHPRGGLGI